jgi:hypothetical protein
MSGKLLWLGIKGYWILGVLLIVVNRAFWNLHPYEISMKLIQSKNNI